MSIEADLAALQSLPASVLSRLIDPSAEESQKSTADARAQLASYDPAKATPEESVAASRAYVEDMRRVAKSLEPNVITAQERDIDGDLLERIRGAAEQVRAAIQQYAADTGVKQ